MRSAVPELGGVSVPNDNPFPYKRHLVEYVNRAKAHRAKVLRISGFRPAPTMASRLTYKDSDLRDTQTEKIVVSAPRQSLKPVSDWSAIKCEAAPEPTRADGSNGPKVSVVLPTHNGMRFLPTAVTSLLGQTLTDFELIIVNDGSTDNTADIWQASMTRG